MMLWIAGAVALIFIGYLIYDIFRAWQRKRRIEDWRRRAKAKQILGVPDPKVVRTAISMGYPARAPRRPETPAR